MNTIKRAVLFLGLALFAATQGLCQTNLQITGIVQTDEQAMQLTWASTNHEIYQIQYANALNTNADGSTAWQTLYDSYPSQGTNTFWLDTGNYNLAPQALHPKYVPLRFYRILDEGPDTASDEPSVSILSPTNGVAATGELTVTVFASTDQPILSGTKLYVDGQAMQDADTTTNYTDSTGVTNYELDTYNINTCEWGNETHTFFATAACATGYNEDLNGATILYGHAVSAFVPVIFSNLVTRISFSQSSFDPASGQTQQVSAVFAANSDWTLNIEDAFSNVVLTATGSGTSMQYNWDGNGTGETNLPAGIYYYYISAETNGESDDVVSGGGSGGGGASPPSPDFALSSSIDSGSSELWATPTDGSGGVVPFALYPPGFDTNGLTVFEATPSEISSLRPAVSHASSLSVGRMDASSDDDSGGSAAPAAQAAPPAPQRPPNNPVNGVGGQFGVAYQNYSFSGLTLATPLNGLPTFPGSLPQHVHLNNSSGTSAFLPFLDTGRIDSFIAQMQRGTWQPAFVKANSQLKASDLEGSGTPFNQVPFGFITVHGAYGTTIDYNANQAKQTYLAIDGRPNGSSSWVGMNQMNFGSPGTNGLKWMAILACNDLIHSDWTSMQNAGITPFNSNLHLMLGSDTEADNGCLILFAKFMLGLDGNPVQPIMQAWYNSGVACVSRPITFAVVGYNDCESDLLTKTNALTPTGSIFYDSRTVRP